MLGACFEADDSASIFRLPFLRARNRPLRRTGGLLALRNARPWVRILPVRRDIGVHGAFQRRQQLQDQIVEDPLVEPRPELGLGLGSLPANLDLAQLLRKRLTRPGDIAVDLRRDLMLRQRDILCKIVERLLPWPAVMMQTGTNDEASPSNGSILQIQNCAHAFAASPAATRQSSMARSIVSPSRASRQRRSRYGAASR